ncbi:hypothetical protein BC941DRAFT_464565 [Chlamydoabsidia padenii]|nr:hypothetical protein BC941DRAFT_464565 [Chlamydoabsidia padenii]
MTRLLYSPHSGLSILLVHNSKHKHQRQVLIIGYGVHGRSCFEHYSHGVRNGLDQASGTKYTFRLIGRYTHCIFYIMTILYGGIIHGTAISPSQKSLYWAS